MSDIRNPTWTFTNWTHRIEKTITVTWIFDLTEWTEPKRKPITVKEVVDPLPDSTPSTVTIFYRMMTPDDDTILYIYVELYM